MYEENTHEIYGFIDDMLEPYNYNNEDFYTDHFDPCCENPLCADCSGSGTSNNRFNEDAFFDWYEIGGRWSGAAYALKPEVSPNGIDFNVIKVKDLYIWGHANAVTRAVSIVVDTDKNCAFAPEDWLTAPENMDKYVVVIDYHS
jgi:hypothetical protein